MKKFALIGCGAIAQMHADAIEELRGGELYGVYDAYPESAKRFAAARGCRQFETLEELFTCADVDIVNVCTPSGSHAELAIRAAKAGKHVIVEKPMAITKEQLNAMVAAVEKHKTKVAVITQLRFVPSIQKAKQAIDEGRLGKILLADFQGKFYQSALTNGCRTAFHCVHVEFGIFFLNDRSGLVGYVHRGGKTVAYGKVQHVLRACLRQLFKMIQMVLQIQHCGTRKRAVS